MKCVHFGNCGGCEYLDIEYSTELQKKEKHLREQLKPFSIPNWKPIVPSPESSFYRNKVQIPFGRRKIGAKTVLTLGLHSHDHKMIIDQTECKIQDPILTKIVQIVRNWARRERLHPYNEFKNTGDIRHLVLKKSLWNHEVVVGIVWNRENYYQDSELSKSLFSALRSGLGKNSKEGKLVGIVFYWNNSQSPMVLNDSENIMWGRPYVVDKIGKFTFQVSLSTFFQINPFQIPNLYNLILDEVEPDSKVLDCYSGIGTISIWMSEKAKEVVGIEENPRSYQYALIAKKRNKAHQVSFKKGAVESLLSTVMKQKFDLTVLDPSRIGLHPQVSKTLVENGTKKIVYVSCYPDSLLRDLKVLESSYKIESVQSVDLFPRTSHLETVVVLTRKS